MTAYTFEAERVDCSALRPFAEVIVALGHQGPGADLATFVLPDGVTSFGCDARPNASCTGSSSGMTEVFEPTPEVELLMTLPGVGFILGVVIALEVGEVTRFASPEKLAAYAGTTPRVHASGGRTRYGPLRPDVNHTLRWALVEAANVICLMRHRHPGRHVSRLYARVAQRKGHPKAIGAVARHLAEATYWILTKREPYRDPRLPRARPATSGLVHGGASAITP